MKALKQILAGSWKFLLLILVLVLLGLAFYYFRINHPATNDASVQANIIPIAASLNGIVKQIYVSNNQVVQAGQKLFVIDDTQYSLQVKQAEAQLDQAKRALAAAQAQVAVAQSELAAQQSATTLANKELQRQRTLRTRNITSAQALDKAKNQFLQAEAQLKRQQSELEAQQDELAEAQATVATNEAKLNLAKLQLSLTTVTAPANGYVSNFYLRPRAPVNAYQTLFGIIQSQPVWVEANFLEAFIRKIRPGQQAQVRLLMYPGQVFQGKVTSIGYGVTSTATTGSRQVLPYVAPKLNWIRLAQRFPVTIELIDPPAQYPIRVGANARVSIELNE
jgi:membrane fusion protein (multidrug efflux system)